MIFKQNKPIFGFHHIATSLQLLQHLQNYFWFSPYSYKPTTATNTYKTIFGFHHIATSLQLLQTPTTANYRVYIKLDLHVRKPLDT